MSRPRIISFDLDGTLLCDGGMDLADPGVPPLVGPYGFREDWMRLGALPLLRGLADEGHWLWVYTQSLRGRSEVMGWFRDLGLPLAGYVNLQLHEKACEERGVVGRRPRKCPHWFGIEVHVDDDEEVARECLDSGCRVILVSPVDEDFEGRVRTALAELG